MSKMELKEKIMPILTTYLKGIKPTQLKSFLKENKIDWVVDIRWGTRYPEYFQPNNLNKLCNELNIDYIYHQRLGNPIKIRQTSGNFEVMKRRYIDYVKTQPRFYELLHTLQDDEYSSKNICFLCYCATKDKNKCHRFWLKELIEN